MDEGKYIRLFNRLEKAVGKHKEEMADSTLTAADEELYVAYEKIMRDACAKETVAA
jgi:hypothetical protein